ncbi:biotin synthase [Tessaracoccus bendigoensis DSM 12906]|uniref:Biotin synthase n=1 Tax=Tessaracoccus bendigoensis DSM 12906 TaxID=1123357 RepID=A0A1M6FEG9_9ACTN|nr:biotin synthase BioB [Tessaracoccus bendigoensis]SHI96120.1 biotin synthase [Tessaracoccus bendigoensis DSM 12906]
MFHWFDSLADRILTGGDLTTEEAHRILEVDDALLFPLVAAAGRIRRHFHGTQVKVNYLVNLLSGKCPEDCFYCSQRLGSMAEILRYPWLSNEEALAAAEAGIAAGARRVCLVASGRGPSNRDVARVGEIVSTLKQDHPGVEVCACLGILSAGQAETLADRGTDAYNHNLNTAESHYANICTTHDYEQRRETVQHAREHGMSACSGLIAGMGETPGQLVEVAFALRAVGADSVPVNFLMPFDGTPLAGHEELTPMQCLRILAMVRFVHPAADVRVAGGREQHLRSLQPLSLEICNSLFLGDYLTSEGQPGGQDLAMIADLGFTIWGAGPRGEAGHLPATTPRARGAGTPVAANA